ncbi:hypothetical protein [Mycobacteroides abscessus]|uniref:hypothetical protein n=1 Tax=Mycobacteroides abscessus TaxID=36809 RepID=UPI003C6E9385
MRNVEKAVDRAIAAANSIPEGPPVGTIARRPDGAWIAFVEPAQPGVWLYRQLLAAGQGLPQGRDADSWPVIYDPTSEKSREEKIQDYLEWSETQVDTDALDPTAQQEPATTHPVSPESTNCVPKPRTPRVVDRLGVDERGSRWRDRQLGEWKFDGQAWRYLELTWTSVPGGEWVEAEPSKRYGPYVEVLS